MGSAQDGIWYATREEIKAELDVKETARSNARIDRALEDASRRVDGLMHRTFAPVTDTRYFDWPNVQYAYPWRIWFDQWELADIPTAVTSGGQAIPLSACNFEPVNSGPPYQSLELRRDMPYSFGVGSTPQRDVAITGLWGYRNTETTAGTLAAQVSSASATTITVDGPASAAAGVGSILRVDNERMIVTARTMIDTGQGFGDSMTAANNYVTIGVANGGAYAVGEMILRDSERMLIVDIAGNTLTVLRAWDGTVLAAHTNSAIYAPRVLTVTRGALGTTAATHANTATVYAWQPPGPIRQLTIAEALTDLLQGRSGYARTAGAGENEREASGKGLADLRDSAYTAYGRKARVRVI
jgi:hypothetical protein